MSEMFIASLKLTCETDSEDVAKLFADRWTRRLERAWTTLSYRVNKPIERALHGQLLQDCGPAIRADVGADPESVSVFSPSGWMTSPDGGYIQSGVLMAWFESEGTWAPWVFRTVRGELGTISVYATFDKKPIRTEEDS